MTDIWVNFGIVLIFVLIGGVFAASEMALVSLRDSQVSSIAERNPRAARRLTKLLGDPNRFLAAVQVGVTLAGFLSAGFGASRIAPDVSPLFQNLGMGPGLADTISFILITIVIAYLSLVLGELAPKRVALQRSEAVAAAVATPVDMLAVVARPFIWLLSVSSDAVVRLLGGDPSQSRERMSEEELRGIVAQHAELTDRERELIDDVFSTGDRELREVMVPRTEVSFLKVHTKVAAAAELALSKPHSRYPVIGSGPDDVLGFVHVRDLLAPGTDRRKLTDMLRPVLRLPTSMRVIPALTEMRDTGQHLAIVVDEYGGTDGIVTLEDVVEELVGEITDEFDEPESQPSYSLTGEREIDGLTNLEDFVAETEIDLPDGPYETVAGFVVNQLGRLPQEGDAVMALGYRFTVTEMDERRVETVRVEPMPTESELAE